MPLEKALDHVLHSEEAKDDLESGSYLVSLFEARWVIVVSIFLCIGLTLFYLKLMDWFATTMAYLTIALVQVGLVVIGYMAFTRGMKKESDLYTWTGIGLWVLAAIYYLCLCCNYKSLQIAIAIVDTAADWINDTKRIVFIPIFYFFVWCLLTAGWIYCYIGVTSITDEPIVVTSVSS